MFISAVRAINRDASGAECLADAELEAIYGLATGVKVSLVESNLTVYKLLVSGAPVDCKTDSGVESGTVQLIDLDTPTANSFHPINQFRAATPGQFKDHTRPDLVLFINGLPVVVTECEEANAFTSVPPQ